MACFWRVGGTFDAWKVRFSFFFFIISFCWLFGVLVLFLCFCGVESQLGSFLFYFCHFRALSIRRSQPRRHHSQKKASEPVFGSFRFFFELKMILGVKNLSLVSLYMKNIEFISHNFRRLTY